MKVHQLMTRTVETCGSDQRLDQAAAIMWERDCGVLPIVAAGNGTGRVVGMLTDRDICMAAYTQGRPLHEIPVSTAMSQDVRSCRPTDSVGVALKVMETNQIRRLPVVDGDDHLVGLLSIADVGREAAREHVQPRPAVTDAALGQALEAIAAPRMAGALTVTP